jgi:hypothetical protein
MGQKQISLQSRDFCTLHAVDIPLLAHRRGSIFFCKTGLVQSPAFFKTAIIGLHPKGYIQDSSSS